MKVVVGTAEKPRVLKAVVSEVAVWVQNDTGGVTKITTEGKTIVSVYSSLEAVFRDRQSSTRPIYEGDTITITF